MNIVIRHNFPRSVPWSAIEQVYSEGTACYGNLGLTIYDLAERLSIVVEQHVQAADEESSAPDFLRGFHFTDLYLATACANGNERAWERFIDRYHLYIHRIADQRAMQYGAPAGSDDLAADVIADLCLPDCSGSSRISSYDGRASLSTWLRTIVTNKAINERRHRSNQSVRLDTLGEIMDGATAERIEAAVTCTLNHRIIVAVFKSAVCVLTECERTILLLIYDDELPAKAVADQMGLAPSTVSYHTRRAYKQLRTAVFDLLATKYQISNKEIEECVEEMVLNQGHLLLDQLRQYESAPLLVKSIQRIR